VEQQYSDGSITIQIDGEKLRLMDDIDLAVYHTPGESRVYIDNGPKFQDDRCVATVQDLLATLGYDGVDGLGASDIAEMTIEVQ
jgi:hypothetical protein